MFPDPIQQAFVKRPRGGPRGTPQDYSLGFGQGEDRSLQFGSGQPAQSNVERLLETLIHLISSSPSYYPWRNNTMPSDGKAFDQVNTIGMPNSGGGAGFSPGPETIVTTLECPAGYDGIVLGISNNVFGPSFNPQLPSLTWRIRNGASLENSLFVDGYNNITVEYGETKFTRDISGILISSGQTLLYTITNNDVTYPISPVTQTTCCFRGFFWPSRRGGGGR